jgi:hypothetical protein
LQVGIFQQFKGTTPHGPSNKKLILFIFPRQEDYVLDECKQTYIGYLAIKTTPLDRANNRPPLRNNSNLFHFDGYSWNEIRRISRNWSTMTD